MAQMGEHDQEVALRTIIRANHSSEAEKLRRSAQFVRLKCIRSPPCRFAGASKEHARLVRGELRDNHLEMPNGRGRKINFVFPEAKGRAFIT